jgi:hypothetical protein
VARCLLAEPNERYRTALQLMSTWRGRILFARPRSMRQRLLDYLDMHVQLLDYLLPMLWAVALLAAGAAILW